MVKIKKTKTVGIVLQVFILMVRSEISQTYSGGDMVRLRWPNPQKNIIFLEEKKV